MVLHHLRRSDGLRQEDLSLETGLDKTTIAHAVKKLVGHGYVSRHRDPVDHRCYRLSLTESGTALYSELDEVFVVWSTGLFEGLTADERRAKENFLRRMVENAERLANRDLDGVWFGLLIGMESEGHESTAVVNCRNR